MILQKNTAYIAQAVSEKNKRDFYENIKQNLMSYWNYL